MLKFITTVFAFVVLLNIGYAQEKKHPYSLSFGANYYDPVFIFQNDNSMRSGSASWGLGVNRDIFFTSVSKLRLTIGLINHKFGSQLNFINSNGEPDRLLYGVEVRHGFLEADYMVQKHWGKQIVYGGIGARATRVVHQNYKNLYGNLFKTSEYGANFIVGLQFPQIFGRPYIQLNYYHALTKAVDYSFIAVNSDTYYVTKFRSRSIGVQLGFWFRK